MLKYYKFCGCVTRLPTPRTAFCGCATKLWTEKDREPLYESIAGSRKKSRICDAIIMALFCSQRFTKQGKGWDYSEGFRRFWENDARKS